MKCFPKFHLSWDLEPYQDLSCVSALSVLPLEGLQERDGVEGRTLARQEVVFQGSCQMPRDWSVALCCSAVVLTAEETLKRTWSRSRGPQEGQPLIRSWFSLLSLGLISLFFSFAF